MEFPSPDENGVQKIALSIRAAKRPTTYVGHESRGTVIASEQSPHWQAPSEVGGTDKLCLTEWVLVKDEEEEVQMMCRKGRKGLTVRKESKEWL